MPYEYTSQLAAKALLIGWGESTLDSLYSPTTKSRQIVQSPSLPASENMHITSYAIVATSMCEHTTPVEGRKASAGHSDGKQAGRALAPGIATEWRQMKKVPLGSHRGERATTTTQSIGMGRN